jgi:hypothetical protein
MPNTGFVLLVTVLLAACDGGGPATPTSPSPSSLQTHIRGWVFDTVNRPVPGARIDILDGPLAGTSTIAADRGAFEFVGTASGFVRLRGSHDGFEAATIATEWTAPGGSYQPIAGITLKTLAPALPIALGSYTLTFISDRSTATGREHASCTGFPADLRRRSYEASISKATTFDGFEVRFAGPTLMKDPGNFGFGFHLSVAGEFVGVELENGFGSGPTEAFPEFRYLMIAGTAPTSEPATSTESSLTIPFWGEFQYCQLTSGLAPANSCSQVPGYQVITNYSCASRHDMMVFTKR